MEAELEELLQENRVLQQENALFCAHFARLEEEYPDERKEDAGESKDSGMSRVLTLEEKMHVAKVEFEQCQKQIEATKHESEKLIATLKAVIEETDMAIADLKKEAYEFKRDIVIGAENVRTGKTMAEKVVKYMEEKLKYKDAMIEKLRLKNVTLKGLIQKVESQLKQKEEIGDVLHYIDFHQLQIENKQYMSKIDERNKDLLKLKRSTGKTVQALNNMKNKLNTLVSENEWVQKEIGLRKEQLEKARNDINKVGKEIVREEAVRRKLTQVEDSAIDMPHILDYVAQKKEMYELKAQVKDWSRKVEISGITRKSKKK